MRITPPKLRIRFMIYGALATLAALAVGGFLFVAAGVYSVSASSGHLKAVEWFLHFAMQRSVDTWSTGIKAPPALDNPDLVTLGAGHFHSGCAYCHGAPDIPISPIAQHMLPPPPTLFDVKDKWEDNELFWIIKHGIKYTGMPGWSSMQRDDEVWAVVAFLKQIHRLDNKSYRDLALGDIRVKPQSGRDIAMTESDVEAVTACGRCHGIENTRPKSNLVPVLHGQPAEYLIAAMAAYTPGKRPSGIMQPVAVDLGAEGAKRVAAYYSGLKPPPRGVESKSEPAAIERGRKLALEGEGGGKIPACISCHGADALAVYPRLAGQNAAYMANRLRLWKADVTSQTETDTIMALVAKLLSDEQIEDASAYFASEQSGEAPRAARPGPPQQ